LSGRDTSGIDTYTDALPRDPALVALRDRVRVVAWPEARPETRVRIGVSDRAYETETNVGIPLTDLDAQWTKLIRKFHALVDPVLGGNSAAQLVATCRNLEREDDLEPFWKLIRGAA